MCRTPAQPAIGAGVVTRTEPLDFPRQAGNARWPAHSARRQGQCRDERRSERRPLPGHQGRRASIFPGRTADDIAITVPVTVAEAALGAKIEVPTIDTHDGGGRTQLKIPPGTQTGQKLRLREKGVPSVTREGARGDQIIEVKVIVPKLQDERSKEILRELAKLNPEDPRAEMLAGI